jgi:hypothetical protein
MVLPTVRGRARVVYRRSMRKVVLVGWVLWMGLGAGCTGRTVVGGSDAGRRDGGAPPDAEPLDADLGDAGPSDAAAPLADAGAVLDAGRPDAGAVLDAGRADGGRADAGPPDAGPPDAGRPDAGSVDAGPTLPGGDVAFPTDASTSCYAMGGCMPLRSGGGGVHYVSGDSLEETVTFAAPSISGLSLSFDMDDLTAGCAVGAVNTFAVLVNGTRVGTYSFTSAPSGTAVGRTSFNERYTFASIAGTGAGDRYTVRLEATSTVCPGGSSWNWFAGGVARATTP